MQLILWQTDQRRQAKQGKYSPIGFNVFDAAAGGLGAMRGESKLVAARFVSLDRELELKLGTYLVVPCMHTPETEGNFTLDAHVIGGGDVALR